MWTRTSTYKYIPYFSENASRNDNLEQQAQAFHRSWLVDFEPFKGGKFVDSELGEIPEGWEIKRYVDKEETDIFVENELGQEQQEFRVELEQELKRATLFSDILMQLLKREMTKQELANALSIGRISGYMHRTVNKLLTQTLIERTIPEKPNYPAQKFKLTERGKIFLELLETLKKEDLHS